MKKNKKLNLPRGKYFFQLMRHNLICLEGKCLCAVRSLTLHFNRSIILQKLFIIKLRRTQSSRRYKKKKKSYIICTF